MGDVLWEVGLCVAKQKEYVVNGYCWHLPPLTAGAANICLACY
jgi:hypothetical protein